MSDIQRVSVKYSCGCTIGDCRPHRLVPAMVEIVQALAEGWDAAEDDTYDYSDALRFVRGTLKSYRQQARALLAQIEAP